MSVIVAIECRKDEAFVVAAEKGEGLSINLVAVRSINLKSQIPESDAGEPASVDGTSVERAERGKRLTGVQPPENGVENPLDLSSLLGLEIDSTFAVVSGRHVLYKEVVLPFSDPRKVEQVLPLQVQDSIPFDIDEFVIDNLPLSEEKDGTYHMLSAIIPAEEIQITLTALKTVGVDPVVITTRASALTGLSHLGDGKFHGTFGFLEFSDARCSLALFVLDRLVYLRDLELAFDPQNPRLLSLQVFSELNSSLARIEKSTGQAIRYLVVVANSEMFAQCRQSIQAEVQTLEFSRFIVNRTEKDMHADQLAWAIGLFANEMFRQTVKPAALIDFRKGAFAYKRAWKSFAAAIQDELFPIALALILGVIWVFISLISASRSLHKVESEIKQMLNTAVPAQNVPFRRELSYLEDETTKLEEQLRGVGSLSSLSPLDALKELSATIPPSLDIQIESLNIGQSRIGFRGSVPDFSDIGNLGSLLKANKRFCNVNPDPKGRAPGSTRINFNVDLEVCD